MSATTKSDGTAPKDAAPQKDASALPGPLLIDGFVEIFPPVLQAPMSSLTTLPTRTLAEEQGCGLTISEWLPAAAVAAGVKNALRKLLPSAGSRPFGIQLFGRDPRAMEKAARIAAEAGATLVDLNMGCPGKRANSGATGAALMREPALAETLLRAAIAGVAGRAAVTVKMRAGWDDGSKNAPELAARLAAAGARMITVHGRTRQQRYSGRVDLEIIRRVKEAVDVPVVANGDIVDIASMQRAFAETGADAVMIGRAAVGNPWLFAQLGSVWQGTPPPSPPDDAARVQMFLRHLTLQQRVRDDERSAVVDLRKFAHWYLAGVNDQKALRWRINRLDEAEAVRALLGRYLAGGCRVSEEDAPPAGVSRPAEDEAVADAEGCGS